MDNNAPPVHRTMIKIYSELINEKWIVSKRVYDSMMPVDRGDFSPTRPYQNFSQLIGYNEVISVPLLHSYYLELLKNYLNEGNTVLDIGFDNGYLTVVMSKMMNDRGTVIGIEQIKDLYDWGINKISKHHKDLIEDKKLELIYGDGRLGYKNKVLINIYM